MLHSTETNGKRWWKNGNTIAIIHANMEGYVEVIIEPQIDSSHTTDIESFLLVYNDVSELEPFMDFLFENVESLENIVQILKLLQ